jgi:hypothetical protein
MTDRITTILLVILGVGIAYAGILNVADGVARAGEIEKIDGGAAPGALLPFDEADAEPPPAMAPMTETKIDPGADPMAWASAVYNAVRNGRWAMVAGLVLFGVTFALRRWGSEYWGWLKTPRGGLFLVVALGLLGMGANALFVGRMPDPKALTGALEAIVTAIAAYVAAKKIKRPEQADG